jgi:hypothetical protein
MPAFCALRALGCGLFPLALGGKPLRIGHCHAAALVLPPVIRRSATPCSPFSGIHSRETQLLLTEPAAFNLFVSCWRPTLR